MYIPTFPLARQAESESAAHSLRRPDTMLDARVDNKGRNDICCGLQMCKLSVCKKLSACGLRKTTKGYLGSDLREANYSICVATSDSLVIGRLFT